MNTAATRTALVQRGYSPGQAEQAMIEAYRDGGCDLARHRVRYSYDDGEDGFAITPLPWPEDSYHPPGSCDACALPPVPLPESFRGRDVAGILEITEAVDAWLDGAVAEAYRDQPLAQDWARVAKVSEELGEAIAELIAVTGQNPRKGVHGTREALTAELADVVCTGLFAIQHFTKDADATWQIVLGSLAKAMSRVPAASPFPPESGMTRQDAIDNGIIDE